MGTNLGSTPLGKATRKSYFGTDKIADPLGLFADPGESAADKAARAEAMRQSQIDQTTTDINAMFDSSSRQKQIADFKQAMQDFYLGDLNRQKEGADRDLTFAMARSGLTGGSRQVDANRSLGEEYQRGILDAERRAQSAASGLRGQDEQSRLNLVGLAQSGLSSTNAASQAAAAMRAALEGSTANAKMQGLGDLFTSVANTKKQSEESAATRRANSMYTSMYGPYWSFGGFSGGKS